MRITNGVPQAQGQSAERRVGKKLGSLGFNVRSMPYKGPFDILCEGKRIEVKQASPNQEYRWDINIHRHGVTNESNVDIYIVVLDGIPGNKRMPLYLVIPAPLGASRVAFSFSSLVRDHAKYIDNWELIGPVKRNLTAVRNKTSAPC
jgi:hypothetical protein